MRAFLITVTLIVAYLFGAISFPAPTIAQDSATVPCSKAKCEEIDLFNRVVELRNLEDDDLKAIEQSYLRDHPVNGLVAADRLANLDKAITKAEAVEAIYRHAALIARERALAYRQMREIEKK